MGPIEFRAIQLLAFTEEDKPAIVRGQGVWTLLAQRNGERIMITAPDLETTDSAAHLSNLQPGPVTRTIRRQSRPYAKVPKGELHPKSKLSEKDVVEMRSIFKEGMQSNEYGSEHKLLLAIAEAFKVHYTTVYKIVRGQSWKHVKNG